MRAVPVPMALLAELTHRCPLKCPYCSNPLELVRRSSELSTEAWIAAFLGAVDGERSLAGVVDKLAEDFKAPRDRVATDTAKFLTDL
ncbi:MAG: PqqD family peptide modification chaperone, partial [Pseudomonadota bacterium]